MNTMIMAELFGGTARFHVLQRMYEQAEHAFGTREIAAAAGTDPGNTSRWLRRWANIGLLEQVSERGQTYYKASSNPDLAPLKTLLQKESSTVQAIKEQLQELDSQVDAAAIFGSTARGEDNQFSDIDILIISGTLGHLETQAHFKPVGRKLNRAINVQVFTPHEWQEGLKNSNALIRDIASNRMIALKGKVNVA